MKPSLQDWIIGAVLLLGALVAGSVLDAYGLCLFVAALIWIVLQQREFVRLSRWAAHPLRRPDNVLYSWERVSERLYRSLARARRRTHRALEALDTLREITNALPDAAIIID
ncbi:MAG: phosphate regulon sensor protein PhoR, partial [Pseudomonadales bacterium]